MSLSAVAGTSETTWAGVSARIDGGLRATGFTLATLNTLTSIGKTEVAVVVSNVTSLLSTCTRTFGTVVTLRADNTRFGISWSWSCRARIADVTSIAKSVLALDTVAANWTSSIYLLRGNVSIAADLAINTFSWCTAALYAKHKIWASDWGDSTLVRAVEASCAFSASRTVVS